MRIFREHELMFCPVQHIMDVETDQQALANGYVVPFDHPTQGRVNIPGYPVHFSASTAGTRHFAPRLGEHTDEILREIGYTDSDISMMRRAGVVR
jgi:crotonobetainyl-CoA:carnitine CoA-transferase CaiB-like acyl-CoA transferase